MNTLIRYVNKEHLNVNDITVTFLNGFIKFLNKEREARIEVLRCSGKRIPSNRSASLYISSVRHLFNEAKRFYNDYDRNIILIPNSPLKILKYQSKKLHVRELLPLFY